MGASLPWLQLFSASKEGISKQAVSCAVLVTIVGFISAVMFVRTYIKEMTSRRKVLVSLMEDVLSCRMQNLDEIESAEPLDDRVRFLQRQCMALATVVNYFRIGSRKLLDDRFSASSLNTIRNECLALAGGV